MAPKSDSTTQAFPVQVRFGATSRDGGGKKSPGEFGVLNETFPPKLLLFPSEGLCFLPLQAICQDNEVVHGLAVALASN